MRHSYDDDCTCDVCIGQWMAMVREFNERAERMYPSVELIPSNWRERALCAEARVRDLKEAQGELLGLVDYWQRVAVSPEWS